MEDGQPLGVLKCMLLGSGGVGKTTFCKRHNRNQFERQYYATLSEQVHFIFYSTDRPSSLHFPVWEIAGRNYVPTCTTQCQCSLSNRRHFYYQGAKCGIVMFDLTSKMSFNEVHFWVNDLRSVCGLNIPIVLLGNKSEHSSRQVKDFQIQRLCKKLDLNYIEISVKEDINIDSPFLYLARKLIGDIQIYREYPLFASG